MGRYDLKLSEDEFWALTLKEFNALIDRKSEEINREDYKTGLLCATMANLWGKKRYKPDDFMPHKAQEQHKKQTPEQQLAAMMSMVGGCPPEIEKMLEGDKC